MDAPDLENLSNDTPNTPQHWNQFDDDDEILQYSVNHVLDKCSFDDDWRAEPRLSPVDKVNHPEYERRRSSGVAVQQMLSQLDTTGQLYHDSTFSAAAIMEASFETLSPTWKVVVETSFAPKYFRNDRKNIQCFPACTLGGPQNDSGLGHGKSTTWCRGSVTARAFAIDSETNIADISMFEAYGAFVMGSENPRTKALANHPDKIRGAVRKLDGRSLEIKVAPTVWKFEPALSKKKSEENRNQCFFVVLICFRGKEVGRCVSPPFDLGSQKAEVRKKRALADEDASWGAKHLVLDTFAQASNWVKSSMGIPSPKPEDEEREEKENSTAEVDPEMQAGRKTSDLQRTRLVAGDSISSRSTSSIPYPQMPKSGSSMDIEDGTRQGGKHTMDLGFFHHRNDEIITASVIPGPKQVDTKRISLALLLWLPPFGFFGAHHMYLGRATYALTSIFTLNMLLLGWIVDAVRLPMLVYSANFASDNKPKHDTYTYGELVAIWLLFGLFGAHRYAAGDVKSGLFYTLTLGGLGALWLWDGFHLSTFHSKITQRN